MIVFYACGGLGNQMFQYAMARQVAIDRNMQLRVDLSWYSRVRKGVTPRQFELGSYEIALQSVPPLVGALASLLRHRQTQFLWPMLGLRPILEGRREVPSDFELKKGAYLVGYWQDERLFLRIRSVLKSEFQPRIPLATADADWVAEIDASESVSIHVRRGDYVSLPSAAQCHGSCSASYYQRAMEFVTMRVRSPKFFVFSDDPAWAMHNLPASFDLRHVSAARTGSGSDDLRLMSRCRHHIIANSSFSWWSAWLGETPASIVVTPDPWFAAPRNDLTIVPARWAKLAR